MMAQNSNAQNHEQAYDMAETVKAFEAEAFESRWIKRWDNELAQMDAQQRPDFLKHLFHMATSRKFVQTLEIYMSCVMEKDLPDLKDLLEETVQDDEYLATAPMDTIAFLGTTYFEVLDEYVNNKALCKSGKLDKTEYVTMKKYMDHMDYDDVLYCNVKSQSSVIERLAEILQHDNGINADNWRQRSPKAKAQYLTRVSWASDYVLTQFGFDPGDQNATIYHNNKMPALRPIKLVRFKEKMDSGEYCPRQDLVMVGAKRDYHDALVTLKHEKAHQLSALDYRTSHDNGNTDTARYRMQLYQPSILDLFEDHADLFSAFAIYAAQPEERLARSAESFGCVLQPDVEQCREFSELMRDVFAEAPPLYDYMLPALDKYDAYLDDVATVKMQQKVAI